jgi:hypothetical protein
MVAIPAAAGAAPKPGAPSPTAPAAANTGGAVGKQPNLGNQDASVQKIVVAAKALNDAISGLPIGTPIHTKALKLATDANKLLEEMQAEQRPQSMIQTLMGMARGIHKSAPMQALARIAPQQAAAGAAPATQAPAAGAA